MSSFPSFKRCPQCASQWCGDYACRFSGLTHERAREIDRENAYAEHMIRRDQLKRLTGEPQ